MTDRLRRRATASVICVLLGALAGCVREHAIELRVREGAGVRRGAAFELAVIRAEVCPGGTELLDGRFAAGAAHHQIYRRGEARPVGVLAPGTYAFAVVARNLDCGVIATGCALAAIGQQQRIDIDLSDPALDPDVGCRSGALCREGLCEPSESDGGAARCEPERCELAARDPVPACCDGACADLASDARHCGACGNDCAATVAASAGCCTSACTDLATDDRNCGACGRACGAGTRCVDRECRADAIEIEVVPRPGTTLPPPGELRVVAHWYQLDAADPDPAPTVVDVTARARISDTSLVVPLDALGVPDAVDLLCARACADEARCGCTAGEVTDPGALGFADLRVARASGPSGEPWGIADVVVVRSPTSADAARLEASIPGEGLGALFPGGVARGTLPYAWRTTSGGRTVLEPAPTMRFRVEMCDPADPACVAVQPLPPR